MNKKQTLLSIISMYGHGNRSTFKEVIPLGVPQELCGPALARWGSQAKEQTHRAAEEMLRELQKSADTSYNDANAYVTGPWKIDEQYIFHTPIQFYKVIPKKKA